MNTLVLLAGVLLNMEDNLFRLENDLIYTAFFLAGLLSMGMALAEGLFLY
jgi:hypothetical protein